MSDKTPIAVIGMGCQFPKAPDLAAFWRNIRDARVCFSDVPADRWNHSLFFHPSPREIDKSYASRGGFIDDIRSFAAPHYGLSPRRVKLMDPQHRLLLDTARVTLSDAGYETRPFKRSQTGVFIGASVPEHKDLATGRLRARQLLGGAWGRVPELPEEWKAATVEDLSPLRAFTIPGNLLNMMAATVSQVFDLGGPSFTIDAACSSALVAIYEAVLYLRTGQCDAALAGGVYLNLLPDNLVAFSRIGAISRSDRCRPFDASADGFVLGEGVGVVMLKRLEDAQRDGDRIYAVVRGAGINNDGRSEGPMTPRLGGQLDVLDRAYGECDFAPDTVGFVEAHGTATSVGDAVEVSALKQCYAARRKGPINAVLSSVKANVGHTMSAAGAAGFIKAALVLSERIIPPQAAFDVPGSGLDLAFDEGHFRIATKEEPWPESPAHPRRAGVSSFGFGGTNCHVVLEEAPAIARASEAFSRPEPFLISAPTTALLARHLAALRHAIGEHEAARAPLGDLARTLSTRRRESASIAFVARSREELRQKLAQACELLSQPEPVSRGDLRYSKAPLPEGERKIAFIFPGQGAQAVGLCQSLYQRFPRFRLRLDSLLGPELLAQLYPEPPFDLATATARLMRTEVCQPIMVALGIALAELAATLGAHPSMTIGHSLGEFAALAAAEVLDPIETVHFAAERGALIAGLVGDAGAMAAVACDRATVSRFVAAQPGVVVANANHPQQMVISGTSAGVAAVLAELAEAGVQGTQLPVSHAFHSPLLAPVEGAIAERLERLDLHPGRIPVVSCIEPGPYSEDLGVARQLMVRHATAPVDFIAGIRQCADAGARIFVQVGAGTAFLSMTRATLKAAGVDAAALVSLAATNADEDEGAHPLCAALTELAGLGVPVNFAGLYEREAQPVWLPATPLETEQYWVAEREAQPVLPPLAPAPQPPTPRSSTIPESVSVAPPVATSVIATAPGPVSSVIKDTAVENRVLEIVAQVSAFPRSFVRREQRLIGELGFDSLMSVDLSGKLTEAFPGLGGVPRSLFLDSTTVEEIAVYVQRTIPAVAGPPEPSATSPASPAELPTPLALGRYVPVWASAPLGQRPAWAETPFVQPVVIIPDALGVAALFSRRMVELGCDVSIGGPEVLLGDAPPRTIIDLRLLTRGPADLMSDQQQVRPPVEATFQLARMAARVNVPSCFVVAYSSEVAAGVAGFSKALAREWPQTRVKAIELDSSFPAETLAASLATEILSGESTVEVRWRGEHRQTVELVPAPSRSVTAELPEGAVVAISGGAGGIGAQLALELARRCRARLVLLGRNPHTPSIDQLLKDIDTAGGEGLYLPCDIRDETATAAALTTARARLGAISVVIHAAGVIADGPLLGKSGADFANVFDVKAGGMLSLWSATAGDPLLSFIVCTSWAGRFGNAQQTDYSAANAAAARLTGALGAARPGVRVAALDLPPWDGTPMVRTLSDGARAMMRADGIPFLSHRQGVDLVLRELANGEPSGEVLFANVLPATQSVVETNVKLTLATHPYLDDHRIDGHPVLPMASAMDFCAAAAAQLLGRRPSDAVLAIRDFELLDGVVMRGDAVWLQVQATRRGHDVAVELRWSPTQNGRRMAAYRCRVGISATTSDNPLLPTPATRERPSLSLADFYAHHTFHGPRLQGIVAIDDLSETHIGGRIRASRVGQLSGTATAFIVDPLLIDSSFQLAVYWAHASHGRAALPLGFAEYRALVPIVPGAEVRCRLMLEQVQGEVFVGHVDYFDGTDRLVAQLRGMRGQFRQPATRPIEPARYRVEKFPEYVELRTRIDKLATDGLENPYFRVHDKVTRDTSFVEGHQLLHFSGYNYLGLSGDRSVNKAVARAAKRWGTSASASRVASGEKPIHRELEAGLSRFLGCEDTIILVGGHATNVSVIGQMCGPRDLIIHDSLAHDSILAGARLSGAARRAFPHNDWRALDQTLSLLRPKVRRVLIAVEGVYSMDGDIPPLPEIIEVKKRHQALLLVDEAHSLGVLGRTGRGVGEHYGVNRSDVELWMGTLSKSLASCGGYISGSRALVEHLKYSVGGFVYSVGMSPPNAASALAALKRLERHPELVTRLQQRSRFFLEACRQRGINTGMSEGSAVIPCIVGNSDDCIKLAQAVVMKGINVQPILYPAVEEKLTRLRFFVTNRHSEKHLKYTAETVATELRRINPSYLRPPRPQSTKVPPGSAAMLPASSLDSDPALRLSARFQAEQWQTDHDIDWKLPSDVALESREARNRLLSDLYWSQQESLRMALRMNLPIQHYFPDSPVAALAASHAFDESRHADALQRYCRHVSGLRERPPYWRVISQVADRLQPNVERYFYAKLVSVTLEEVLFAMLIESTGDALLKMLCGRILRDKSRHISYVTEVLRRIHPNLSHSERLVLRATLGAVLHLALRSPRRTEADAAMLGIEKDRYLDHFEQRLNASIRRAGVESVLGPERVSRIISGVHTLGWQSPTVESALVVRLHSLEEGSSEPVSARPSSEARS